MGDSVAASVATVPSTVLEITPINTQTSSARDHEDAITPGRPTESFNIQEPTAGTDGTPAPDSGEENSSKVYPSGPKLYLTMTSIILCAFLRGLDMTIVAVTVPSLTDTFRTIADIAWYSAAFNLISSATVLFFGRVYSIFDPRRTFLASIVVILAGTAICTFATSSKMFVVGRATVGLGSAWQSAGVLTIVSASFPLHKRPVVMGALAGVQGLAMVSAPVIGGLLTQRWSWRACFGIGLPLNALTLAFTAYGMQGVSVSVSVSRTGGEEGSARMTFFAKLKQLDFLGAALFIPGSACLLMALQYGGTRLAWADARTIVLLVGGMVLLLAFAVLQMKLQERATLPPRIAMQRSVLAGAWFDACCGSVLAITEYYVAIYFQGVKGLSPAKSGMLSIPMIAGLTAAAIVSGFGISAVGYYTPFMLATSVIAPVASGVLSTLDLDDTPAKASGLLALLGFGIGIGLQGPMMSVSTTLKDSEVSLGTAAIAFGGGIGNTIFISIAGGLFQRRVAVEVAKSVRNVGGSGMANNVTATFETGGLSDLRNAYGGDMLKRVLTGYDSAVVQTLYLPVALSVLSILGSGFTEWKSVKQKKS